MSSVDSKTKMQTRIAVAIQLISTNTTTPGFIQDLSGYESTTFVIASGTGTDGVYRLLIEDGNDPSLSDAAPVEDKFLIGTEADTEIAGIGFIKSIGYVGKKRYVRASIVSTGVTSGATMMAIAIHGDARDNPTSDL